MATLTLSLQPVKLQKIKKIMHNPDTIAGTQDMNKTQNLMNIEQKTQRLNHNIWYQSVSEFFPEAAS
jgi:hypothetical protein